MPRRLSFALLLALFALALPALARAQTRPAEPIVSIVTFGPGPLVFERFGHNAIRVQIPSRRIDYAFDWGNFSFEDPGFIWRFVRGDMRYWMMAKHAGPMLKEYAARADRTVTEQRLQLTPAQSARLLALLDAQDRDENRFYRYDYYADNCSTRVRDAVDAALDGALKRQLQAATPHGYRWHTRRLLSVGADNRFLSALIDFSAGPRVDRPLSEWDLAFLPMELSRQLDTITLVDDLGQRRPLVAERRVLNTTTTPGNAEPAVAGRPAIGTTLVGIIGALLLIALGRAYWPGFVVLAALWEAWAAFSCAFLVILGGFSRHWAVAWNLNVLHFSPLAFVLLGALLFKRWRRHLKWAAPASFALSLLGAFAGATPLIVQHTLPAVGLALPLHAAVFYVLRRRPLRPAAEGTPS